MRMLAAFLTRDWRIHSSYRMGPALSIGGALLSAVPFFFVGKLIVPGNSPLLAPYGGAYFPFVLLGLACSRYVSASLSAFGGVLREEQIQGTLEAMLIAPASVAAVVMGGALWQFLWTTLEVALFLALGALLFGTSLAQANWPAAGVLLALLIVGLSSVGMLSACGLLLFKEADPVTWVLGGFMRLVGGVYFPVALLPGWLKSFAACFPLTYGLEGVRQAVLMGHSTSELSGMLITLALFSAVGWLLAIPALMMTMNRLKRSGTLSFR